METLKNTSANAIEIRGLTRTFSNRVAVNNLSLTVGKGEFFSLLGVNGAGKTTTIKMLCCLLPPTSGDAFLMGESITKNARAVKQLINVSPQETAIAPNLTVSENLALIARIYGISGEQTDAAAKEAMAEFKLTDRAKDMAGKLSGGLQRRLSIAMALISKPSIVFLDEPTLGLDVRARRDLWHEIEKLKGRVTVILTTHYLEEAEALSDRIAIMQEGSLRAMGTAAELKALAGKDDFEEAFITLTDAQEVDSL